MLDMYVVVKEVVVRVEVLVAVVLVVEEEEQCW